MVVEEQQCWLGSAEHSGEEGNLLLVLRVVPIMKLLKPSILLSYEVNAYPYLQPKNLYFHFPCPLAVFPGYCNDRPARPDHHAPVRGGAQRC